MAKEGGGATKDFSLVAPPLTVSHHGLFSRMCEKEGLLLLFWEENVGVDSVCTSARYVGAGEGLH